MPDHKVQQPSRQEVTVYRRTTIAAAATALALLGGGSALAANAGLFGGDHSDGAGTLPAVSTPDPRPVGDGSTPSGPPTSEVAPSPADEDDESYEEESDDPDDGDEVEDDD